MVALLRRLAVCLALCVAAGTAAAFDIGERHHWNIEAELGIPSADSDLAPWTEGGLGKLRFPEGSGLDGNRILAEYRGQVATTVFAHAVLDFVDGPSSGLDLTEAYLDWKPVPRSANQHAFRFGAFYPPFSLENGESGWTSPFTTSFSAINAWLGEEIRPIGAEWSLRRRLGTSPHEIGVLASAFFGNDPAGTLLFWRGWSLHDRQLRLNDKLPMPPGPVVTPDGAILGFAPQRVEPIAETDHEPGYYAGFEWRYARRALVQLAAFDNRADPYSFGDGQWGWHTRFRHLAAQISLTRDLGLVTQWMRGSTQWLVLATRDGQVTPISRLETDEFESAFVLLTRRIDDRHRISLRRDVFDLYRPGVYVLDEGRAWTVGYEYSPSETMTVAAEYLRIESSRDFWPLFYDAPRNVTETQLRIRFNLRLHHLGNAGASP